MSNKRTLFQNSLNKYPKYPPKYPTARGELAAVRQVPLRKRELIAQLNEYTQKGWPTWENSFQRDGQNPLRLEDLDKKKKNNA